MVEIVNKPQMLPEQELGILPAGLSKVSPDDRDYRLLLRFAVRVLLQRLDLWDQESLTQEEIDRVMKPHLSFMAGMREELIQKLQSPANPQTSGTNVDEVALPPQS